jgi:glutamate-ammonia-ligase adenylyltransferase
MREKMELERDDSDKTFINLKTCRGGLIDLEFLVQALQMRYGGASKSLRIPSTLPAIRELAAKGVLKKAEARIVATNYEYLRRLDIVVRLNNEKQSFLVSRQAGENRILAAAMNERSTGEFLKHITRMRKENRFLLTSILRRCKD